VASTEARAQWLGKKCQRTLTGAIIKTNDPTWFGVQSQPAHIKEEDDAPHAKRLKKKIKKDNETVENDRHKEDAVKLEAPKRTRSNRPAYSD
jgi:hypothetical protein